MRPRSGVALPAVLLLLAALGVIGIALSSLSLFQHRVASASEGWLRARLAASGAVQQVLVGSGEVPSTITQGTEWVAGSLELAPGGSALVRGLALGPEMFILIGSGSAPRWKAHAPGGKVMWRLDPAARLAHHRAVAEVGTGSDVPLSGISGDSLSRTPDGWPAADCDAYRPVIDSLFPTGSLPPLGDLPSPPTWVSGTDPGVWIGLLAWSELERRADRRLEGAPAVVSCEGSGLPGSPCDAAPVFRLASESLHFGPGSFRGLAVAGGHVTLAEGARFTGLLMAGGDVVLAGGAVVEGYLRAGQALRLLEGGLVRGMPCAVLEALDAARTLRDPVPVAGRSWVGPLDGR